MTNSKNNDQVCCSFCGIEKAAQVPLISGNDGQICEACVNLAHQVVSSWGKRAKKDSLNPQIQSPLSLKKHLDQYVIGQDRAKEILSVAVFTHYLRLLNRDRETSLTPNDNQVELEKSNILLLGPSGTGKTLLVRSLAKVLGVPFSAADATSLTQAGYVGDDVDSIIIRLLEAAGGDVQLASWGIVYIDEIDKLAKRAAGATSIRDISGEGVQQALLKLVEGTTLHISKTARRRDLPEEQSIDTRNILFIVGGAFAGIEQHIQERIHSDEGMHRMGFVASPMEPASEQDKIQAVYDNISADDLQSFGLIPEFVGRFPVLACLKPLDRESLIQILTEPKNALLKQFKKIFEYQNVNLEVSQQAIEYFAEQALLSNTGARGLRSVLESALHQSLFELPERPEIKHCILDLVTDSQMQKQLITVYESDEDSSLEPAQHKQSASQ